MNCRVLVVDDDDDIRSLLRELLEEFGHYQVSEAANGAEALALIRRSAQKPELILLDLMMPVMNGFELARRLRADPETASIPVVVISATATRSDAKDLGSVAFLPKPFRAEALLSTVGNYC